MVFLVHILSKLLFSVYHAQSSLLILLLLNTLKESSQFSWGIPNNPTRTRCFPKVIICPLFLQGPLMCPAESLATAEVFLALTVLLQRFKVFLEDGCNFDIESREMSSSYLPDLRLHFESR